MESHRNLVRGRNNALATLGLGDWRKGECAKLGKALATDGSSAHHGELGGSSRG